MVDKRAKNDIVYKPEDADAAGAFKKYLFLKQPSGPSTKISHQLRNQIDAADYYKEQFKATRDSEFNDQPQEDLDLTELRR